MYRLIEVGRPLILQYWRPDSCIASTRIAVEVLRANGHRARPMAVEAYI